ncbi:MAG: hypothetical protein HS126_00520 [Anaerolineales bacterium]|nr:hypothetical protein [Anaerolineales bacterium]
MEAGYRRFLEVCQTDGTSVSCQKASEYLLYLTQVQKKFAEAYLKEIPPSAKIAGISFLFEQPYQPLSPKPLHLAPQQILTIGTSFSLFA